MKTYLLPGLAVLALLLGAADTGPPTPQEPPKVERNFTIRGSSLTIQPGPESTYLRFGGGIVCTAKDMHLSADVLELDISSASLQMQGEIKFPAMPSPLERAVDDPGELAQAMASELELPKASFSGNAITRVGAKGSVKVEFQGLSLETGELVSTDGGNSWVASGRTKISSKGLTKGTSFSLSADYLFFDLARSSALAKGNIVGNFAGDGFELVKIQAQRLELNQATGILLVSEGVVLEYGSVRLSCGQPAGGNGSQDNEGAGGSIEFNLESHLVVASGGVVLFESLQGLTLSAAEITVSIAEMWAEATGNPRVERGQSSFSGERILVTDLGGKVVVEVSGPQEAIFIPTEPTPDEEPSQKENLPENPGDSVLK